MGEEYSESVSQKKKYVVESQPQHSKFEQSEETKEGEAELALEHLSEGVSPEPSIATPKKESVSIKRARRASQPSSLSNNSRSVSILSEEMAKAKGEPALEQLSVGASPEQSISTSKNITSKEEFVPIKRSKRVPETPPLSQESRSDSVSFDESNKGEDNIMFEELDKKYVVAPTEHVKGVPKYTKSEHEDLDVLGTMRSEAIQFNQFSRYSSYAHLSKEELQKITIGADQKRMFWAAYEIAIRFPKERPYLESLLRVNNTPTKEKRSLMILIGDIYRNVGERDKAQQLYRGALLSE
jgi:hypothetical protein